MAWRGLVWRCNGGDEGEGVTACDGVLGIDRRWKAVYLFLFLPLLFLLVFILCFIIL